MQRLKAEFGGRNSEGPRWRFWRLLEKYFGVSRQDAKHCAPSRPGEARSIAGRTCLQQQRQRSCTRERQELARVNAHVSVCPSGNAVTFCTDRRWENTPSHHLLCFCCRQSSSGPLASATCGRNHDLINLRETAVKVPTLSGVNHRRWCLHSRMVLS